ncbi:cysteine-rich receptor-like protein kinase 15 [Spinacia oleracea]|uniref:Cysteine-rich receptor-like protein kinase 15 n=1 Tax=Spinacia oleracea TaxID=3562 RepID=A0ABM3RI65_SPIOL|nr:cysteine-rich receptor-like protein kinase 15 [Spinacia oleracea]
MSFFFVDPIKRELLLWETRYKIITGIARGLQYLHKESRITIVHRHMKISNILLDIRMNPKFANFGWVEKHGISSRIDETRRYMAPEYFLTGVYSEKSDVYSFGIIILEIVSGQSYRLFYKPSENENLLILVSTTTYTLKICTSTTRTCTPSVFF